MLWTRTGLSRVNPSRRLTSRFPKRLAMLAGPLLPWQRIRNVRVGTSNRSLRVNWQKSMGLRMWMERARMFGERWKKAKGLSEPESHSTRKELGRRVSAERGFAAAHGGK